MSVQEKLLNQFSPENVSRFLLPKLASSLLKGSIGFLCFASGSAWDLFLTVAGTF